MGGNLKMPWRFVEIRVGINNGIKVGWEKSYKMRVVSIVILHILTSHVEKVLLLSQSVAQTYI